MEDWWLVRDSKGQVGWMLSRRLDVDVPDEIAGYSEGQKIVGAYVLTRVYDSESSLPDKMVPEYVSVTNAYKDGLPYDFDQVRVFTWNTKKHRYETAYRQRNVEGYLPVKVSQGKNAQGQPVPEFSITVATSDEVKVDPLTGAARPVQTDVLHYQLEGGMVKRVTTGVPPGSTPVAAKSKPVDAAAHHHPTKEKGRRVGRKTFPGRGIEHRGLSAPVEMTMGDAALQGEGLLSRSSSRFSSENRRLRQPRSPVPEM